MLSRAAPRLVRATVAAPLRTAVVAPRVRYNSSMPPRDPVEAAAGNRSNTNLIIGGTLAVGAGIYWFMMERAEDDGMKKVIQMTDKAEKEEKIVNAEHEANKGGVTSME